MQEESLLASISDDVSTKMPWALRMITVFREWLEQDFMRSMLFEQITKGGIAACSWPMAGHEIVMDPFPLQRSSSCPVYIHFSLGSNRWESP
jgi:hypothetical protein